MGKNIAVIGASGAIGAAFVEQLAARPDTENVAAFSRSGTLFDAPNIQNLPIDLADEASVEFASTSVADTLDCVVVTTGMLHDDETLPEKSFRNVSAKNFQKVFAVNTIGPALVAKYFLPKLHKDKRVIFAVLSARVGSITDNRLGGWHAYRASKAALNMILKNASIEMARNRKQAIIVGLHPGTVASDLSEPFQKNVPPEKLFTPEYSVSKLLEVLDALTPENSGKCYAWDGKAIEF